jgi:hypothetical protein
MQGLLSPFPLFPPQCDVGIESDLAFTAPGCGLLIRCLFAKSRLNTEAPWAFEISHKFLDSTPSGTREFHSSLLIENTLIGQAKTSSPAKG